MPNMTIAIPEDLHRIMKRHKHTKWSEIARTAIREHATKLEFLDEAFKNSTLTEKDAEIIGKQIKKQIAQAHLNEARHRHK